MQDRNTHLSDETLLLFADGETRGREEAAIRAHLSACWPCRLRMRELEDAIADAARMHRQIAHPPLPAPEGPRALLKARLRELAADGPNSAARFSINRYVHAFALFATIAGLVVVVWRGTNSNERDAIPRSELTPGAIRAVAATDVCAVQLTANAEVMPAVQRKVLPSTACQMPSGGPTRSTT